MICTIYSHYPDFEKITEIIKRIYPKGTSTVSQQDEFNIIEHQIKGGFFSQPKKIKIAYRQRSQPSYYLPEVDDSALTRNLKGLYGFVQSLPTRNEKVKDLFLQKILTLNCEFSVFQEIGETAELRILLQTLARELDAILFVQPDTIINKSGGQHFLDKNLNLIIDGQGQCEIETLDVKINSIYFDSAQSTLTEDQQARKAANEEILRSRNIKLNQNLPCIESEKEATIRQPGEIAQRVTVLAITNLVAFNTISAKEAIDYLVQHDLWQWTTPKERAFLEMPTDELKNNETWKCECIWILLWALGKVGDIGFPDKLCNLSSVPPEDYPVGKEIDPNNFIQSCSFVRPAHEILNANDLYYRLDWACVDARVHQKEITGVHPGVVYERHYALNWLIRYEGQDWDDVSCDT